MKLTNGPKFHKIGTKVKEALVEKSHVQYRKLQDILIKTRTGLTAEGQTPMIYNNS